MKNLIISLSLALLSSTSFGQNWNNPENQMLSDSISSFFYYSTNTDHPFSDPRSLRDTEYRSKVSDDYHEESEHMIQQGKMRQKIEEQYRYNYNRNFMYYNHYPTIYLNSNY